MIHHPRERKAIYALICVIVLLVGVTFGTVEYFRQQAASNVRFYGWIESFRRADDDYSLTVELANYRADVNEPDGYALSDQHIRRAFIAKGDVPIVIKGDLITLLIGNRVIDPQWPIARTRTLTVAVLLKNATEGQLSPLLQREVFAFTTRDRDILQIDQQYVP